MIDKPKKRRGNAKGCIVSPETRAKISAAQKAYHHNRGKKCPEHAEFMRGTKNALVLTNRNDRMDAFKQYCQWISMGNSSRAFVFQHPELRISGKTMEKYIKDFGHEFPLEELEVAHAFSLCEWEGKGHEMMIGKIKHCQPALYQMFMRNKFGWDREQQLVHSVEPEARELLRRWKEMDEK